MLKVKPLYGMLFGALLMPMAAHAFSPEQVYARAAKSVVTVIAVGHEGKAIGSGVVIQPREIVTNCHVIDDASLAHIRYQGRYYPARVHYSDTSRDLCQLTVPGLPAPAVARVPTSTLRVGETVYAIGSPVGLDRTLSNGLISALRHTRSHTTIIQTTAAISQGSSGGGLFDNQGRLVGITTYYLAGDQHLNFALPADWIAQLPARHNMLAAAPGSHEAAYEETAAGYLRDFVVTKQLLRQEFFGSHSHAPQSDDLAPAE